jgi:hypothetical protein
MAFEMEKSPEQFSRRCPRLGGPVEFSYCETCGRDKSPCFKIFDCWWEFFDVISYMKEKLSEEEFNKLTEKKPQPKITSIVELVRAIQKDRDAE